jgi:hypothetical protein
VLKDVKVGMKIKKFFYASLFISATLYSLLNGYYVYNKTYVLLKEFFNKRSKRGRDY